jgi:hypothetical protein
MIRWRILLILSLLLCHSARWATGQNTHVKSASSPNAYCAERYEINSEVNAQPIFAYFHHDHLQTPLQATDKSGNLLWAAQYNAFGRASIITPAATADKPTIQVNLRLPGQYEDAESGLHDNYRRFLLLETQAATVTPVWHSASQFETKSGSSPYGYCAKRY